MKSTNKKFRPNWRRLIVIMCVFVFIVCAEGITLYFPASCGVTAIFSPQTSYLIEYTDPPSGMIQRRQDFNYVKIKFLRPVREMDAQELSAAMRLFAINNYWEMNGDEPEIETLDVVAAFNVVWSPCVNCNKYPDLPPGPYTDEVVLWWNKEGPTEYPELTNNRFYSIHILEECEEGEVDDDCTYSPITSYDGVTPTPETLMFIGLVENESETVAPVVDSTSMDELIAECDEWREHHPGIVGRCYVPPHHHLKVNFSEDMGFINPEAIPAWGFYFNFGRYRHKIEEGEEIDYMTLESDSAQGMSIGRKNEITSDDAPYILIVRSDDAVPEENTMNIPYTIDRYGNPLSETFVRQIYPSHVSITFPIHFPYSGPDNWYGQLKDINSERSPYIQVAVTDDVAEIRAVRPGQPDPISWPQFWAGPDVYFSTVKRKDFTSDNSAIIYIPQNDDVTDGEIIRGSAGYPSTLEVHAYDSEGHWLGADMLDVYAFPSPPEKINVATFNAWQMFTLPEPEGGFSGGDKINTPYYCDYRYRTYENILVWQCFEAWLFDRPEWEYPAWCYDPSVLTDFQRQLIYWDAGSFPPPLWTEACRQQWRTGQGAVVDLPPECNPPCWYDPENCPEDRYAPTWPGYCFYLHSEEVAAPRSWKERLHMFVEEVIVPSRPAIIAIQEVYHEGRNCPCVVEHVYCKDMYRGYWLNWLLQDIEEALGREGHGGGRYLVASNQKANYAEFWPGCDQFESIDGKVWSGDAILYDPLQVNFVPAFYILRDGETDEPNGCKEWTEMFGYDYYEYLHYQDKPFSDCMTFENAPVKNDSQAGSPKSYEQVQRAIFEFPRGSNHFFNFYNTHLDGSGCNMKTAIDYIRNRQSTFHEDLEQYLEVLRTYPISQFKNVEVPQEYWTYPPVFAGDTNLDHHDYHDCGTDNNQFEAPYKYFWDPVSVEVTEIEDEEGIGAHWKTSIDKVMIGREEHFPPDPGSKYRMRHLLRHEHQEVDYECFYDDQYYGDTSNCYCDDLQELTMFRCSKDGFNTNYAIMSDHGVVMVELIAEELE